MRLLISGGGTGGGVYPALAIITALRTKEPNVELLWIGSASGPERKLVKGQGIKFKAVPGGPIAGMGARAALSGVQISAGVMAAMGIVAKFKPDVLLMTGGWVTIPATLACRVLRVPIVLYVPDVEPGGALKSMARFATKAAVIAPETKNYFKAGQAEVTGNPVRAALLEQVGYDAAGERVVGWDESIMKEKSRRRFTLHEDRLTVLVFGGSRGARSINQAMIKHLPEIVMPDGDYPGCQVIHISGATTAEETFKLAEELSDEVSDRYRLVEYLYTEDMALALTGADLVVSRAGATVLGEFPLFGLPAILVPYPHAWRYQKVNADRMVLAGAGLRLDDDRLADELAPTVRRLVADEGERETMAKAMRKLRQPDAAMKVADMLIKQIPSG